MKINKNPKDLILRGIFWGLLVYTIVVGIEFIETGRFKSLEIQAWSMIFFILGGITFYLSPFSK